MAQRVLRVALTGGIATGKSHCLRRFAARGAAVIDADVLARTVVESGSVGHAAVVRRFGAGIIDQKGEVDRARLAAIVFADPAARKDLEQIVHPAVYDAIRAWLSALSPSVAIADIPLLFETHHESDFDVVIVAACSPETQIARLMARNHLTLAEARQRLATQLPIDEKRRRATHVIDTSGSIDATDERVDEVWEALLEAAKKPGFREDRGTG